MRPITDTYAVSPQISAEDMPAIKAAGITTVICNRPDAEVPPSHQAAAIGAAAEAEGLVFHVLPITHQTLTPENVARQKALIEGAGGPVLAYCASGTRSTIVWALGQAGERPAEEIIGAAAQAGYDLSGLRGAL
ncbi:TIGR01244 family sulfur transferase [Thetidibacter halocola]|uniref:TIGR01244 family phosphatase n=1 Tax=Thetidibacter halocola TaxID=2827239 RepID=A0A8J8BAB7_9RHOB|nr:TIGR01244 family sulfur transferase [Thetidibacter halocola]MBS0126739.1 TIGR01244 family phosphatase [Thetidibacter halocola]